MFGGRAAGLAAQTDAAVQLSAAMVTSARTGEPFMSAGKDAHCGKTLRRKQGWQITVDPLSKPRERLRFPLP